MNLEEIKYKNKIIDHIYISVVILGVLLVTTVIIRDYPNVFNFNYYSQIFFLVIGLLTIIFRYKLTLSFKVHLLIIILFIVLVTSMLTKGYLGSAKVYVIFSPVFYSFIYSYKKSIIVLLVYSSTYLAIGYLLSKTSILIVDYQNNELSIPFINWCTDTIILLLCGFSLIYIGDSFKNRIKTHLKEIHHKNNELIKYQNHLESLVKQRTEELETANEELTANNEELHFSNDKISKQKIKIEETYNQLKETQKKLIQTEKMASLGILTAGVAHEVNNPLNFLQGGYDGLSDHFKKYDSPEKDKIKILLNSIEIGIERISAIVSGLNQFSRDNISMKEDCDIHSIIENCFTILKSQTKHKINIVKTFLEQKIITKGNVGKIHQAFLNILTNSIHAIADKGEIIVKTSISQNSAIVEIIDNGVGIEKNNLKQILDPFFTTKAPNEGTGLGLSIVYSIITEHGGSIDFESKLGRGTKVIISLPIN